MTDGKCATPLIDYHRVDWPSLYTCKALHGERLIEFDCAHVMPFDSCRGKRSVRGHDGCIPEVARIERHDALGGDSSDGCAAHRLGRCLRTEEHRRGPVAEWGRVARGDGSINTK